MIYCNIFKYDFCTIQNERLVDTEGIINANINELAPRV